MDEILQKLLESELLSEESKAEMTEKFEAAKQNLREELALEVRAELVEQWTEQRDTLIQSVDEKVTEMLGDELDTLKEDISRFRDLEVEFAEKLVTEKHKLAEQLGSEIDELVEKLDTFLEFRLTEEMNELKEDLEEVRKDTFGRKIFEAFTSEFNKSFHDEDSALSQLAIAEEKLADAESKLYEMERGKAAAERSKTMESVLAPLTGVKREQMEMILQNVETRKLQEAYNMFVGRVLKESAEPTTNVEDDVTVLSEEKKVVRPRRAKRATKVVTGDVETPVKESITETDKTAELLKETLRLAGVK